MTPASPTNRSVENSGSPTYRIEFKQSAQKELDALRKPFKERIDKIIQALARDPRPPGCKALKGKLKGLHRVRLSNFRIIYQIQDDRLIVTVIEVADRRDVY